MSKVYATTSVINDACYFRKDYSHAINSKCLECKFCYKNVIGKPKERRYLSRYIETEAEYSKELYSAPVVISRYCEPFLNDTFKKHSLYVANNIIENGGQVIFRTSKLCEEAVMLKACHPNDVHIQLKTFLPYSCRVTDEVQALLAPNMSSFSRLIDTNRCTKLIDSAIIDPLIIGVNHHMMRNYVAHLGIAKVRKIIVKQLFATQYFKDFLKKHIDGKFVNMLDVKVGKYYTYRNDVLLYHLIDFFKECEEFYITPTFCMNKELNDAIATYFRRQPSNCCQFDDPVGWYDDSVGLMDRVKPRVIKRDEC